MQNAYYRNIISTYYRNIISMCYSVHYLKGLRLGKFEMRSFLKVQSVKLSSLYICYFSSQSQ